MKTIESSSNEPVARTIGFKPGERNVFLHILTACNLSCAHCYINPDQHGHNTISKETMGQWIDIFADPDKKTNMIFLGGEPTMHPELSYGIKKAKEKGFDVTVDSNGYLFNDLLENTTPELLDYLSFSLDGPSAEVNDPIRGEGVFDVCTKNIKRAVAKKYNISVIYTVSSRNIDYLPEMIPLLTSLGVKRFFIQVIGLRGNSANESLNDNETGWQVTPDQWLSLVPAVAHEAATKGIHVVYPKVFLSSGESFECAGSVAENYFVFPNGRVYQCPLCEDHPINAYQIENNLLVENDGLTEKKFFDLSIPEGCVMNKLLQPENIIYNRDGTPMHRISCCLLKMNISPKK